MTEENKQVYTVQNTKEAMALGFKAAKVLKESKENDGKIDFNDAPNLLMLAPVIGPAIDDIDLVPKELADVDEAEAKELTDFARKELGDVLSDDELIEKINASLEWVVSTVKLIRAWA